MRSRAKRADVRDDAAGDAAKRLKTIRLSLVFWLGSFHSKDSL